MDAVNGVGGHVHGALETKGHVRTPQIVVNGFGQGDHIESFGPQEIGGFVGSVAAQDDQAIQLQLVVRLFHGSHLVHPVCSRFLDGLEGGATAAQECAALGENSGEIIIGQKPEFAVNEPLIPVQKTINFHLLFGMVQGLCYAPHGGVQRLAVAAAG